jgi:hypothetical protein
MKVIRQSIVDSASGLKILPSPSRQVFGLDPLTKNILVPIDLCLYSIGSRDPDFNLPALSVTKGLEIVEDPSPNLLGKVVSAFNPNVQTDVNPIVTLDNTSSNIPVIDSVNINTVNGGDKIFIRRDNGNVTSGVIAGNANGIGLIQTQIFPTLDPTILSLKFKAIEVRFSSPIGENLQGIPIIMQSSQKVLGMLLGVGDRVLAYHIG